MGGQLKELKDQLEAEQYFTVILIHTFFAVFFFFFFAPSLQNHSDGENMCKITRNPHVSAQKSGSPSLLP